jgi:hypothetical protein
MLADIRAVVFDLNADPAQAVFLVTTSYCWD